MSIQEERRDLDNRIAHLLAMVKFSLVYFQLKTGVFLAGLKIAEDLDIFSWVEIAEDFIKIIKIIKYGKELAKNEEEPC